MSSRTRWILLAAVVGLPLMTGGEGFAQVRVGDDGRALDANNRVGSGGYNDQGPRNPYQPSGNQVVTGNVTDGKAFRGPVGYRDANEFRDITGGERSDRFIRDSSGSTPPHSAPYGTVTAPTAYYGESSVVTPPEGFVRNDLSGGGYVPAPAPTRSSRIGDTRVGAISYDSPALLTPQPGELMLVAPTAEGSQSRLLTASPVYGVRAWTVGQPEDNYFLSNFTSLRRQTARDRMGLDQRTLDAYRAELEETVEADRPKDPDRIERPFENPQAQPLAGRGLNDPLKGNTYSDSQLNTNQSQRSRMLQPPTQQSSQYNELSRRLEEYYGRRSKTDADFHREYVQQRTEAARRDEMRKRQERLMRGDSEDAETPTRTQPGATGTEGTTPGQPGLVVPPVQRDRGEGPATQPSGTGTVAPRPEPLQVDSLAKGVRAEGLASLLKEAEDLMAEGKFSSAIDRYAAAHEVAPNNPMVLIGRAHAELGAAYYARAEAHIREAVAMDPAVLVAQYDLRKFIGEDRLATVVKELKEIAGAEEKQSTAVFLLAYVAYNIGNESQAASYLDLAEKRSQGDSMYKVFRDHWKLPQDDMNK